MSPMNIAIAGFSGKFARLLTNHLLSPKNSDIQIHGIARNTSKIPTQISSDPRVTILEASSDDTSALRKALHGVNVCVCCYLGDKDLMVTGQKTLIDACIAEGVPRYVASDWSLDYRGVELGELPPKDPMKLVRAYLEEKESETSGKIKGVHVLNGAFMDMFLAMFGIVNLETDEFSYWGTGDEKFEMTTYDDAAKITAEVALDKDIIGFVKVLGDAISTKQMAETYASVFPKTTPTFNRRGSLSDLYAIMTKTRSEQRDNVWAWMGMNYFYYMLNGSTTLGPKEELDNARFPDVHLHSVEEFLRKCGSKEGIRRAVAGSL